MKYIEAVEAQNDDAEKDNNTNFYLLFASFSELAFTLIQLQLHDI